MDNVLKVITHFDTSGCILKGYTALPGTTIEGLNFSSMRLEGCNFCRTRIKQSHFSEADLRASNFKGAIFRECTFKDALADCEGFTGVIIAQTDLTQVDFGDRFQATSANINSPAATMVRFEKKKRSSRHAKKERVKQGPDEAFRRRRRGMWARVVSLSATGTASGVSTIFIFSLLIVLIMSLAEAETISPREEQRIQQKFAQISKTWQEEFPHLEPPVLKIGVTNEGIPTACKSEVVRFNSYCPADNTLFYFPAYTKDRSRKYRVDFQLAEWFVLNHEYGHAAQFGSNFPSIKGSTKKLELEADCLAGVQMYEQTEIGLQIHDTPSKLEDELSVNLIRLGDYFFEDDDHHGTGLERQKAFLKGYQLQHCQNL